MKDSVWPSVTATGAGLSLSPDHVISLLGIGIGVFGLILGLFRYYEAKRANNINQQKNEIEERKIQLEEQRYGKSPNNQNSEKKTK